MAAGSSTPTISLSERSLLSDSQPNQLPKWLFLSLLFHGALIISLFIVPFLPSRHVSAPPIYTVDLVGGEKIGGNKLGTELLPPPAPKEVAKEKPTEKSMPLPEKAQVKEAAKKEPPKKETVTDAKRETKSEENSLDSVRERIIQSAVERAKNRTENTQKTSKGDVISAGPGEGEGAAALGQGGRGGGVVKGMDFIIYQNRLLNTIKNNWVWAGQRSNVRVIVHFNIKDNGEIFGLKIVQPSGNPSYDESVLRAVKKSSPLPPIPEGLRSEFSDIELAFRPEDLGA